MAETSHHRTILVVTDDPALRQLLKTALADAGYRIVAAEDGAAALALLCRPSVLPSLIVYGQPLLEMQRWQFRTEQARDPILAAIPVVVLVAREQVGREQPVGAAAYIEKPIEIDTLLDVVRRCCGA